MAAATAALPNRVKPVHCLLVHCLLKRVAAALRRQARLKRAGGDGAGAGAGGLLSLRLLKASTEESGAHSERVASAVFSPDGKTILSGSHDKSIAVWDAEAVLLDAKEGAAHS